MKTKKDFKVINVFSPTVSISDIFSVLKSLKKNNISGTSNTVEDFEKSLSNRFNRKHTICVSNGSTALDLAFNLLDLKDGDEVIVPSFTIVSCLSAILRTNAKPVFCDIDPDTWNMSLNTVQERYSSKTKAVLMVHTYGLPAEAKLIEEFCKEKGILLIEDAAEAHGQNDEGKLCGSFGQISTMSFYANKHITTGEGGAVLVDDDIFSSKLKQMRNLDFKREKRFVHDNLYWNYRLGGLQAAMGLSQIKNLEKTIRKKIKQGTYYQHLLSDYSDMFELPISKIRKSENHYWVFGLVLKKESIRDQVLDKMYQLGIETRPFFHPLHKQPVFLKTFNDTKIILNNSERIGRNGLYLPMGAHINKSTQKKIVSSLISVIDSLIEK
jgi:perosamine synthetase